MIYKNLNRFRLLAVALTSRGFGYAVLEGELSLIESGHSCMSGPKKNALTLAKVKKLMAMYQPGFMVLHSSGDSQRPRTKRLRTLYREIVGLAARENLAVEFVSDSELRCLLVDKQKGTKHERAEMLAQRFPNELGLCVPAKRRLWQGNDARMDLFDAVALAVASGIKERVALPWI